jgi:hypothetical protein
MDSYESIVTIGLRGDGDEPMSEGANIALLEKIVQDQRQILHEVTGKDATTIPQVWALYKEVQEYYDKGMRVPDDVTLMLCDDNWGNIRKLPALNEKPRAGGYGIYYHYDYVGGPRNYKWVNTNQISRVWEQMHLAYEYGARQVWIVNVGDIKPMELPTQFFLDYAWDPDQWPAERIPEYTQQWAQQQFGERYSKEIADLLTKYTTYNARRKPELLSPDIYSLVNYREAEKIVHEYRSLAERARRMYETIPAGQRDAFYQLVLYPVAACANLNELFVTVGQNHLFARQGRAATNDLAARARTLFQRDSALNHYYNAILSGGKWNHMMDQTHISYTYWQQPEKDILPPVQTIELGDAPEMGIAIEGSEHSWPGNALEAVLPEFDPYNQQSYYIDIFNRGKGPYGYSLEAHEPWIQLSTRKGEVKAEERVLVSVDWKKAPTGRHRVPIIITGPNASHVTVQAVINYPLLPKPHEVNGFVESNGYVSIEAEHYAGAVSAPPITWLRIPDLGRTLSAMTPIPVTSAAVSPGGNSPHLQYRMHLFSTGEVSVHVYCLPSLNFRADSQRDNHGLRYAISFDEGKPQTIDIHASDTIPDWKYPRQWNQAVSENIKIVTSRHSIGRMGEHVLKFWMVDPGVVLQKLVVETGIPKPSYLGPPESFRRVARPNESSGRSRQRQDKTLRSGRRG